MNKTYKLIITKRFLNKGSIRSISHYAHVKHYWAQLGGKNTGKFAYLKGTDEILIEFILTYPYSQYVNIKEII